MAADPLRCPACSGAISSPGRARCEWCGAALPAAPAPAPLLAPTPAATQGRAALPRDGGLIPIAAVLLLLLAFAFFFLAVRPGSVVRSEPPAPQRPSPASHDAGRADPPRGQ